MTKASIVTATLDSNMGQQTLERAAKTAGVRIRMHAVVDEHREGGVKTANRALQWALESYNAPYICYINDDTDFPQSGWLKALIDALELDPKHGIAGPSGNCASHQSRRKRGAPYKVVEMKPPKRLSFFTVVFRRKVLEQVGLLDERFIHYACDNDFCIRATNAGWKIVWAQHVWIEHKRGRNISRWKQHDLKAFGEKWGTNR